MSVFLVYFFVKTDTLIEIQHRFLFCNLKTPLALGDVTITSPTASISNIFYGWI